jgi:hypothetical protein
MAAVRFWFGIVICGEQSRGRDHALAHCHCPYHARAGKTDDSQYHPNICGWITIFAALHLQD